jgi:hypothetical protein
MTGALSNGKIKLTGMKGIQGIAPKANMHALGVKQKVFMSSWFYPLHPLYPCKNAFGL